MTVPPSYVGNFSIPVDAKETIAGVVASITGNANATPPAISHYEPVYIEAGAITYRYCSQDYLRTPGRQSFPFIPQVWVDIRHCWIVDHWSSRVLLAK